jgi:hypothetical protein
MASRSVWSAGRRRGSRPRSRAALWSGTAASFVDLTPKLFRNAWACACARGLQVGWGDRSADLTRNRAILWHGSPEDYLDLHDLVPAPWNRSSASDLVVEGTALRIVGTVSQMAKEGAYDVIRAERTAVWEAMLLK